jgi:hypothetical protein
MRKILRPGGKSTSFGIIARLLGLAKATVAEHYTRYLAEQCYGLRTLGRPRRLPRVIEEAMAVKVGQ